MEHMDPIIFTFTGEEFRRLRTGLNHAFRRKTRWKNGLKAIRQQSRYLEYKLKKERFQK